MSNPSSNLLSALRQAQESGYPHDFLLDEDGNISSHSGEVSNPKIIEIVHCQSCGATLYLMASDNLSGTLVHHWETNTI